MTHEFFKLRIPRSEKGNKLDNVVGQDKLLDFSALYSNTRLIVDKPEVFIPNPEEIGTGILQASRGDDRIICEGLR